MRTRSILKITILGCLAFAATAFVSGATVGAEAGSASQTARLKLGECSGLPQLAGARCGSIRVPLDRANPNLGTTRIAFALVPRRDTSRPALGTVVLSGGPITAFGAVYVQGLGPLRGRRDVLFIDQRGSGRSDAIACPALRNFHFPGASHERLVAAIGACGRQLSPRAGGYGTAAAADDIEAVRAALELERLDLWASSYATYLMTVYAGRHPAHVRSLVLHGAFPIDFDPWARDRLAAARRAIGLVCTRTRACRGEAVLRDVARLAARLRRHPRSFTAGLGDRRIRLRLDEAALATLVYAGDDAAGYGSVPAAVASALDGDLAPMKRLVEASAASYGPGGAGIYARTFAQQCHDYPRAFSFADAPAARRAAYVRAREAIDPRAFAPFSAAAWTATQGESVDTCLEWPNDATAASPLPAGARLPDVPVLVLSGDLDANTPTSAGREAASRFPRATFVEIPNVGHTPESSACAVALGLRFAATLRVNTRACVGTGSPPSVAGRAPRLAAQLPPAGGAGTSADRRALAVVVATAADLDVQSGIVATWGAAGALRGGRYVASRNGVRLVDAKVVRNASISGVLVRGPNGTNGTLRLIGPGVPDGRLQVRLAGGRGQATGTLDGRSVDLAFRF
jgi:pimeloyl-ACP methyl ester carboxylesterase